jgi:5-methylcytosine-specific restriction endonuclease McrA
MTPEEKRKKHAAYMVVYLARNPDKAAKARDRARAWAIANPERYKANMAKAHIRNAEKRKAKSAKWKRDNPEKAKANALDGSHRRRVRIEGNGPNDPRCRIFIRVTRLIESFLCPYCQKWHIGTPSIDHKIPISRGGPHSLENLSLCCLRCNSAKGALTVEEFMAKRAA